MIHGYIDNKIVSAEEFLVDLELRTGKNTIFNRDLLEMPIKFDGNEVDAFILDENENENELIIQLVLPFKCKFDDNSNVYKTSYVRKLINSSKFLSRFNSEFVKHVKTTEVHTSDYVTNDKLWLLSHEEVNRDVDFLKCNQNCYSFELFKHIDLVNYSKTLLTLNGQNCWGWRLRSAYSNTANGSDSRHVGYVNYYGSMCYDDANYTSDGALLPACTIC